MSRLKPVHHACGTRVIVKSVIDDFLKPAIVFWCPTCETAMGKGECDREIDLGDITGDDIVAHVEDFGVEDSGDVDD